MTSAGSLFLHTSLSHTWQYFCGGNGGYSRDVTNAFLFVFLCYGLFQDLYFISTEHILPTCLHPGRWCYHLIQSGTLKQDEQFVVFCSYTQVNEIVREMVHMKWEETSPTVLLGPDPMPTEVDGSLFIDFNALGGVFKKSSKETSIKETDLWLLIGQWWSRKKCLLLLKMI